jgi:hypothetical protein
MERETCPHCGVRIIPSRDGTCPSCRRPFPDAPEGDQVPGRPSGSSFKNPYQSPATSSSLPSPAKTAKAKEPFSHQSAKFSAYAPFILFLMSWCVQGQIAAHRGTPTGVQLSTALAWLSILTTVAAFALGFVGLVGGIQRRAARTIVLSVVGILLNTALLTLWGWVILLIVMRG